MKQYTHIAKAIQTAISNNPSSNQQFIVDIAQKICLVNYGFQPRKCELQRLVKHYHKAKDKKAEYKAVARLFESDDEPQPQLVVEREQFENKGSQKICHAVGEPIALSIKTKATVNRDRETALEEYTEGQKPVEYDYIQRFKLVHKY